MMASAAHAAGDTISASQSGFGTVVIMLSGSSPNCFGDITSTVAGSSGRVSILTTQQSATCTGSNPLVPYVLKVDVGSNPAGHYSVNWSWPLVLGASGLSTTFDVAPPSPQAVTPICLNASQGVEHDCFHTDPPISSSLQPITALFDVWDLASDCIEVADPAVTVTGSVIHVDGVYAINPDCTGGAGQAPPIGKVHLTLPPLTAGNYTVVLTLSPPPGQTPIPVTTLNGSVVANMLIVASLTVSDQPNVIEYYDPTFDHYFMTSLPAEIELLDAHQPPFQDWVRTGNFFVAWNPGSEVAGVVPICRFFNDSFDPKSSHFYAAQGLGCEQTISEFPDWKLETSDLFEAALPAATGFCPAQTVPVYRLYNNGMGGAPNHRFVTRQDDRQTMLNQGWIPEGYGIGVGMCAQGG